jgi:dihydroneopterin aldolase
MRAVLSSLGKVGFKHLKIRCLIGVNPYERVLEQDIYVDLKVLTDFSKAAESDDMKDAINYEELAALCKEIAIKNRYNLIEKYAADVLKSVCEKFPVKEAWICVRKPAALPEAECALVELETKNSEP